MIPKLTSVKNPRICKRHPKAANPKEFYQVGLFGYRVTSRTPELDIRFDELTGTWRERIQGEGTDPHPNSQVLQAAANPLKPGRRILPPGLPGGVQAPLVWLLLGLPLGDQQCVSGSCLLLWHLPGSPGTELNCSIYQGLSQLSGLRIHTNSIHFCCALQPIAWF